MDFRHFALFLGILFLANYASSFCIFSICLFEPNQPAFYIGEMASAQPTTSQNGSVYYCNPDPRVNREYRPGIDTCVPTCNYKDYACNISTCTCKSIYTCNDADPNNMCTGGTCQPGQKCISALPATGDPICVCDDYEPVANCSAGNWQPGYTCENDCGRLNTPGTTFTCNKNCQCEPQITPIVVSGSCAWSNATRSCGGTCPEGKACAKGSIIHPNFSSNDSYYTCYCKPANPCAFNNATNTCGGSCSPGYACQYFMNECACYNYLINSTNQSNCTLWSNWQAGAPYSYVERNQLNQTRNCSIVASVRQCLAGAIATQAKNETNCTQWSGNQTNYTCAWSNLTRSCGGTCPAGLTCALLPVPINQTYWYSCRCGNITAANTTCNWTGWKLVPTTSFIETNYTNNYTRKCINFTNAYCINSSMTNYYSSVTCTQWSGNQTNYTCAWSNLTRSCGGTCPAGLTCALLPVPINQTYWYSCRCGNITAANTTCNWTGWKLVPTTSFIETNYTNNYTRKCINFTNAYCINSSMTNYYSSVTCSQWYNQTNYTCAWSNLTRSCGGTCPTGYACNFSGTAYNYSCSCKLILPGGNATGTGVTMKVSSHSGIVGGYQSVTVDINNGGTTPLPAGTVTITINGEPQIFNVAGIPAKEKFTVKSEYSCATAGTLPITVSSSYAAPYAGSLTCSANYGTATTAPLTASSLYSENALQLWVSVFGK